MDRLYKQSILMTSSSPFRREEMTRLIHSDHFAIKIAESIQRAADGTFRRSFNGPVFMEIFTKQLSNFFKFSNNFLHFCNAFINVVFSLKDQTEKLQV